MIKDYKIIKWNDLYYVLKKEDHNMSFARKHLYKNKLKKKCQEWVRNINYPRRPNVSISRLLEK